MYALLFLALTPPLSSDLLALPRSRKAAQALGVSHYFTEKPCANGHLSKRYTDSGKCLSCQNEYRARYRSKNIEKARQQTRQYVNEWRAKNPEVAREKTRAAVKAYEAKPIGKMKKLLRTRLHSALQRARKVKNNSLTTFLGCSYAELVVYLENQFQPGMTWQNQGEWHVDHIRPIASFDQPDDPECWHYTNLQPLWAVDNLRKGASWSKAA